MRQALAKKTQQKMDSVANTTKVKRRFPTSREDARCLSPLSLRSGLILKNRVIRAAAFGGSSVDDLIRTHVEVAKGGVAMTTIAYAAVSPGGRTFDTQILLTGGDDNNALLRDLRRLTSAVHDAGAAISIQLTHAGSFSDRKVTKVRQLAPSPRFNPAGIDFPKAMDGEDLKAVKSDFVSAALLVKSAGFDCVELHVGHGYLLSQFLCPFTNFRTDRYGGPDIANRVRYPLEVFDAVRDAVGHAFPIVVKLNMHDGFEGGMTLDDAIHCAKAFALRGADALVLTGGFTSRNGFYMLRGTTPLAAMAEALGGLKGLAVRLLGPLLVPTVPFEECFFRDQANAVREAVGPGCPVCLLGGITSLSAIEGAVCDGFDLVQMARALIHNPSLVRDIERHLDEQLPEAIAERASAHAGRPGAADVEDVKSGCNHCNECVVATLDPKRDSRCVLRHISHAPNTPVEGKLEEASRSRACEVPASSFI